MRSLKYLFGAIFMLLFQSCTTEIKLARSIEKEPNKISILCEYPDVLFLSNSLTKVSKTMAEMDEVALQDSLYFNSEYIQYIDDTIFLREFREQMKSEFEGIGVNYYQPDDLNNFLVTEGDLYIVSFKQLEIEERWESYHAQETFGETTYEEDFWIKGVSLNAWFDVAKVNDTVEIQRQLYHESVIKDEVDGMFFQNQWSGEVHYQYRLDTLEVSEIGELKYVAAEEFSYLIFNFIVNKEIRDHLNYLQEPEPINDWSLRPGSKRLIPNAIR